MRGPWPPDHVPRPAGAGRVHGPEPNQAATGSLHHGIGETVHTGGNIKSPGHDRPESQHAHLGQSSSRDGRGRRCRRRCRRTRSPGQCRHRRRDADSDCAHSLKTKIIRLNFFYCLLFFISFLF